MKVNLKIDLIKNHLSTIPSLALLLHDSSKLWGSEKSLEEITMWFNEWLNEEIPLAFIALDGDKAIGMCSLQLNDGLPSSFMPWLGDLCVAPAYRNQGIAKKLIEVAEEKAKSQGFEALYLFAPNATIPQYYARLSWIKIGTELHEGHRVTVMKKIIVS